MSGSPRPPGSAAARAAKRGLDLFGAVALALLAAPVVLTCALLIKVKDPGPAFFRQRRDGEGGRTFVLWKLRTMRVDADEALARWLALHPEAEQEWRDFRRLSGDPRVVGRLGRALRRTSVDELPQLWNVIRGDMSLVGPRPLELELVGRLSPAGLERRRAVRPGLTGLWQISGRSELDLSALEAIDDDYVRGWTLALDLSILRRTPFVVVSGRGAY